ncbi:hypothetical protein K7432_008340 [Basidiobolus ranarum]|uniref:Exocyst complex component Sec3 C-terminal domain-containing protein n=1 Tax=Basidiobolus ranarum TaxID=34480 RepID=A0ABR2WRW7_9FUNG
MEVDELLDQFNWNATINATALESKLSDELASLETVNVKSIIEADGRMGEVIAGLDKALEELENLDDLMTLYYTELDTMDHDVKYIQSLNKGLQVQASNQKKLLNEVSQILESVTLPDSCVSTLREESLESLSGIGKIEENAAFLQKQLQRQYHEGSQELGVYAERVELFTQTSNNFSTRVMEYLKVMIVYQAEGCMNDSKNRQAKLASLKIPGLDAMKKHIQKFRGLTLWLKEMEFRKYNDIQMVYVEAMSKLYRKEIREVTDSLRIFFQPSKRYDDYDYVFTTSEKSQVSSVTRSALGNRRMSFESNEPKMKPDEAFKKVLSFIAPTVIQEQNYFIDFFHFGDENEVFQDWVENRRTQQEIQDLSKPRQLTKDRKRKQIKQILEGIFDGLAGEISTMIDNGSRADSSCAPGMLACVEQHLAFCQNQNQDFLSGVLTLQKTRLTSIFERFVDEQLRAIEDKKVKTKKRSGMLSFVMIFPNFVARLEDSLGSANTDIRQLVSQAYGRIVKTMFDSLDAIAKEADSMSADDKEQLNIHILTMENMHHFFMEIRRFKIPVLEAYGKQARDMYEASLSCYVKAVMRRPLARLLEFFDGVEGLLKTTSPEEVSYHLSYNKVALRKVVALYPGKEVNFIKKCFESFINATSLFA